MVCQRAEVAFGMADRRSRWVFSLRNICEMLNLEPRAVGAAVAEMGSDHEVVERPIRAPRIDPPRLALGVESPLHGIPLATVWLQ
jgi:hypothetical protein